MREFFTNTLAKHFLFAIFLLSALDFLEENFQVFSYIISKNINKHSLIHSTFMLPVIQIKNL